MSALLNPFWGGTVVGGRPEPDWANVVLLMGFTGSDGSTTFDDESQYNRTATAVGNAQIDTAISKFGGGAYLSDGSGDCIQLPSHTLDKDNGGLSLEAGYDVQMEAWIRFAAAANLAASHDIITRYNASFNNRAFLFNYNGSGLAFSYSGNGGATTTAISATWTPSVQTWYHVAFSRVADISRLFVDGALIGESSAASWSDWASTGAPCRIGGHESGGAIASSFHGHMDEVRIAVYEDGDGDTKLYTTDFAPPTAAFPRS